MTRTFTDSPAVRSHTPLLVGLWGPAGCGKTYSALRIATGLQRVVGGDIFVIDTEANRSLHYADEFKFNHLPFGAPFGSLDYLSAIDHCLGKGAKVIVIDSMSHEHEGEGGLLDQFDAELARLGGQQTKKFLAWAKPKAGRRKLINGVVQRNCNFIFCFRAQEKIKPVRGGEPEKLGYQPIGAEPLVFEMTLRALLPPGCDGVPDWTPDNAGEKSKVKLPKQFRELFKDRRALDEAHGEAMAKWAAGGANESPAKSEFDANQVMCTVLEVTGEKMGSKVVHAVHVSDGHGGRLVFKTTNNDLAQSATAYIGTGEAALIKFQPTPKGDKLLSCEPA